VSGTTWGRHQTAGKGPDPTFRAETRHSSLTFETSGSHPNHWDGRDREGHRLKAEGKPMPAWDTVPCSQSLGREVSAVQRHYHQLLCAARPPPAVNASPRPHPAHSSTCGGQSFVTLPSVGCQENSSHSIITHSPTQAVSGWRRGVRYTLCPHIPSCRGASPTGRIPPSPQTLIPRSQAGSIGGWAEMACRGGVQDGETPPDPREENGILLHLFGDKASLRSQIFQGNTFPSLSCQVFALPLGGGGDGHAEAKCVPGPGQCSSSTV